MHAIRVNLEYLYLPYVNALKAIMITMVHPLIAINVLYHAKNGKKKLISFILKFKNNNQNIYKLISF